MKGCTNLLVVAPSPPCPFLQVADSIYLDTTEVEIAKERVRKARQAAKAHAAATGSGGQPPRDTSVTRGRKDPLGEFVCLTFLFA